MYEKTRTKRKKGKQNVGAWDEGGGLLKWNGM
jgi:hypothetical protein